MDLFPDKRDPITRHPVVSASTDWKVHLKPLPNEIASVVGEYRFPVLGRIFEQGSLLTSESLVKDEFQLAAAGTAIKAKLKQAIRPNEKLTIVFAADAVDDLLPKVLIAFTALAIERGEFKIPKTDLIKHPLIALKIKLGTLSFGDFAENLILEIYSKKEILRSSAEKNLFSKVLGLDLDTLGMEDLSSRDQVNLLARHQRNLAKVAHIFSRILPGHQSPQPYLALQYDPSNNTPGLLGIRGLKVILPAIFECDTYLTESGQVAQKAESSGMGKTAAGLLINAIANAQKADSDYGDFRNLVLRLEDHSIGRTSFIDHYHPLARTAKLISS